MTSICAYCDRPNPDQKLYPPREWVEHLQTERGVAALEGVLAVPLCGECHDRLALLRDAFRERASLDADSGEPTRDRIETVLATLTIDALVDETGPEPDDVQSVL